MLKLLKGFLGGKEKKEYTEEEHEEFHEIKQKCLENILGEMHNMVGHAIIPFEIGGAVDMYYFPNGIPGTAFATMELLNLDGPNPKRNKIGTYELVAFTKHNISGENEEDTPFNTIERRFCGTFTTLGNYSFEAELNTLETCEVPVHENELNRCIVFDLYGETFNIGKNNHFLMLCIEVFKKEMEYAMEHGSDSLLSKLKEAGHYPYSDLARAPVV